MTEEFRHTIKINYSENNLSIVTNEEDIFYCSECNKKTFSKVEIEKDSVYQSLWSIRAWCSNCKEENCILTLAVE